MKKDNIYIFSGDRSKKFHDLVVFTSESGKSTYIDHGNGYSHLFKNGIVPIGIIRYLHKKEQDFGYVLGQIWKGISNYEKNIPLYSEIALRYLRQLDSNPLNSEFLLIDSLSKDLGSNNIESINVKKEKIFKIHLMFFYCFVYQEINKDLPLGNNDLCWLFMLLILSGISEKQKTKLLVKSDITKADLESLLRILNDSGDFSHREFILKQMISNINTEYDRFKDFQEKDVLLCNAFRIKIDTFQSHSLVR